MLVKNISNLSNVGKKIYRLNNVEEIQKIIDNLTDYSFEELYGLALNPRLDGTQITTFLDNIQAKAQQEENILRKTSRPGQRGPGKHIIALSNRENKLRNTLLQHKNISSDLMNDIMINRQTLLEPLVSNKHLPEDFLKKYIDKYCDKGRYIQYILRNRSLPNSLLNRIYEKIKTALSHSDDPFNSEQNENIIISILVHPSVDDLIIIDILTFYPVEFLMEHTAWNLIRSIIRSGKNVSNDLRMKFYSATNDISFLPSIVKDMFIF